MLHYGKNLRAGRPFVIYIYKKRLIVLIERRTKDARLLSKERNRTEDAMSLEHAMGVMKTLLCFFLRTITSTFLSLQPGVLFLFWYNLLFNLERMKRYREKSCICLLSC